MFSFLTDAGLQGSPQKPCQAVRQRGTGRAGFTLPELLAVIVIIGILAAMVGGGVITAQKIARQTHCKSSLKQFGVAIQTYRAENQMKNPPWLSRLYPDYIDTKNLYICKSDKSKGNDQPRPKIMLKPTEDSFVEVMDNKNNTSNERVNHANKEIQLCSYFYEFSWAIPSWGFSGDNIKNWPQDETSANGRLHFAGAGYWTWCDLKENQLRYGDVQSKNKAYSESLLPIIRCYHHWSETSVDTRPQKDPDDNGWRIDTPCPAHKIQKCRATLNVAYAGNVYVGPLKWECTVQPGDRQ